MKKNLLFLLLGFVVVIPALAQKSEKEEEEQTIQRKDVPRIILEAFGKSHPKSKIQGYSKEKDNEKIVYEIESKEGRITRDVSYDANGNLLSVEETVPPPELPRSVRDAVAKSYPKWKIVLSEKIMKGMLTQYEVLLQSGKQKMEIVISTEGEEIKKEMKDAKEDDD